MKLQIKKVTEIKEGQVWQKTNEDKSLFVVKNNFTEKYEDGTYVVGAEVTMYTDGLEYGGEGFCPEQFLQNECKLIGALGIDYEIVEGKLIKKEVKHPCVGWVYDRKGELYMMLSKKSMLNNYNHGSVWESNEGVRVFDRIDCSGIDFTKPIGSPAVYELKFVEE